MKKVEYKRNNLIKKTKVILGVVVVVLLLNITLSKLIGFNLIETALENVIHLFNDSYTKEVKKVVIDSDDYKSKNGGSYHIEKSAYWTGVTSAKVHFDVDTVMKTSDNLEDVIFILDISGSMTGDKLDRVKSDSKELVENLLTNKENKVALITFESNAKIVSKFTNDRDSITKLIDDLSPTGCTNYNQALMLVNEILKDYQKQSNRDVVVLFLTDGYPNEETHNEIVEYEALKEKYPYLTINAIQYEMGTQIVQDLINISDEQYYADMETLNNVLFDASLNPEYYESFEIVDWIANDYFEVESEDDIKVSLGSVKLENIDGKQKITWTIPANTLRTGSSMTMDIDLKLKEQYVGSEGYYPTNEKEEVKSKLPDEEEKKKESEDVPVLKSGYKVHYDANYPSSCKTQNYSKEETHYAFENVKIRDEEPPTCEGYIFKGWGLVSDAKKINDDYFQMPSHDVYLKGKWTSLGISKSMDGKVHEKLTLYKAVQANGEEYVGEGPSGSTDTIYYYESNTNNNVLYADMCWSIIRTTETGGIKLLYSGLPSSIGDKKVCNNTGADKMLPDKSTFNTDYYSLAYVGYMYNIAYPELSSSLVSDAIFGNDVTYTDGSYQLVDTSNTKDQTHHYTCNSTTQDQCSTVRYYYYNNFYIELQDGKKVDDALDEMLRNDEINEKDSDIKKVIDEWYENNLLDKHDSVLEDTIYCNDRSIANIGGWNKDGSLSSSITFHANSRHDLTCQNKNDRFTVSSDIGNGKLTYPIGLLTSGEANLVGNDGMKTGEQYWLLTPLEFLNRHANVISIAPAGFFFHDFVSQNRGVRPAVSLKPNVEYSMGDGTEDNPYVIIEK